MEMDSPEQNLAEELYLNVLDVNSENAETRRNAEENIKVMEVVPEFPEYLLDIALDESNGLAPRQMSILLLKRHIDNNWPKIDCDISNLSHSIDSETRTNVKRLLLDGLKQPDRLIRNTCAYCIGFIICKEWPLEWSDCFHILNQYLRDGGEFTAIGVIRVYYEIIHLVEEDIRLIIPVIMDELCGILLCHQKYILQVRIDAVYALTVLINLLDTDGKDILVSKLPSIFDTFVKDLQMQCETVEDYEYKTNVIKFLTIIVNRMSKQIMPYLPSVLPPIWNMVMTFGDLYNSAVFFDKDLILETENEEGKPVGFAPLVLSIFDFIQSVVDCSKTNQILTDVLPDIIYYVMIFMLITKKMEESMSSDYLQFFNGNNTENYELSIRITASDVLMLICREFRDHIVIPSLSRAINRHITEASEKENTIGGTCYWKIHEVCQYTLGITKDLVISNYQKGKLQFDLRSYLLHWQYLPPVSPVLLSGRSIWFAAKYSSILCSQMYANSLEFITHQLRSESLVLKVCAVQAINVMCETTNANPNLPHLKHYSKYIIIGLLNLLNSTPNHDNLILLSLQTLKAILNIEKDVELSSEERIMTILNNLFVKYNHDPEIMEQVKAILKSFCIIDRCVDNIQHKFVPTLCNLLTNQEKIPAGVQVVAVDMLMTIVQYSKLPFRDILVQVGFSSIIKSIIKTDDYLLMISGTECLQWLLILGSEKIFNYTDGEGTSGIEYIFQAINKLLDPACPEMACSNVGRVIMILIIKAGPSQDTIHHWLKAILSKMQRVENSYVWESLISVFCYLFYRDTDATVSFLTAIPGPTGVSALEFVLSEWLFRECTFSGFYERRMSGVALCKILEYGVTTNNGHFDTIMVRDELISKGKDARDDRFTMIPVLGKIFKTVVVSLGCLLHGTRGQEESCDCASSTSGHSDCGERIVFSEHYDPFVQDPLLQVEESTFLTDYMHKFKMIHNFESFYALLDAQGQNTLASINIRL